MSGAIGEALPRQLSSHLVYSRLVYSLLLLPSKGIVLDLNNFGALFKGPKVGTELNNWSNCCIENSGENGKWKSLIEQLIDQRPCWFFRVKEFL